MFMQIIEHSDIPLTIATIALMWATIHLWSDRDKERVKRKVQAALKPWKRTHTEDYSNADGSQFHETDSIEVGAVQPEAELTDADERKLEDSEIGDVS